MCIVVCITLLRIALYCIALYCIAMNRIELYCIACDYACINIDVMSRREMERMEAELKVLNRDKVVMADKLADLSHSEGAVSLLNGFCTILRCILCLFADLHLSNSLSVYLRRIIFVAI